MIEATVLLKDGEKVSFTASDMIQAAVFVERQYYPYEKVDIVRVEMPVQQDETKGALPLSTIGHPTAQGRVLATAAQCRHCIRLVRLRLTSFPPEGFHPSGLPFCDQRTNVENGGLAHGSRANDPTVPGAEVNPNVAPVGRIKGGEAPHE